MLTASTSRYPSLAASLGPRLAMTALPIYEDYSSPNSHTLSSGNGLWVLTGKAKRDYKGVGLFLAYVSRPAVQAKWHRITGDIPVTRQAYELTRKSGFYATFPWAEIAILSTQPRGKSQKHQPPLPRLAQIRSILDSELEAVWKRSKTPKEALDDASIRGTRLLRGK